MFLLFAFQDGLHEISVKTRRAKHFRSDAHTVEVIENRNCFGNQNLNLWGPFLARHTEIGCMRALDEILSCQTFRRH
jgi:hypothetical protein